MDSEPRGRNPPAPPPGEASDGPPAADARSTASMTESSPTETTEQPLDTRAATSEARRAYVGLGRLGRAGSGDGRGDAGVCSSRLATRRRRRKLPRSRPRSSWTVSSRTSRRPTRSSTRSTSSSSPPPPPLRPRSRRHRRRKSSPTAQPRTNRAHDDAEVLRRRGVDTASEADESETLAESPATEPRADSEAETELDAPSEVGESELPAESATTQPAVEAEPDTAAVAAPTADSAGAEPAVEAAVADAMPEESPTTPQRAARAPAWAWVAITLMALLLMSGLITLAVARNANPSTPAAVEDAQTLITELETLNGYLATTNQLMANAIASAEQLSAAAQAKLAGLSAKLADAEPRVGQARALLGDQLSGTTRSELDNVQQQLQSHRLTLTQRTERLEEQLLATIGGAVAGLDDRVGGATGSRASASEARIAALEGKQAETEQSQGPAPGRGRPAQGRGRAGQGGRSRAAGGHSGPAGACARRRCSDPTAQADRGGAPSDRRQAELAALGSTSQRQAWASACLASGCRPRAPIRTPRLQPGPWGRNGRPRSAL